MHVSCCAHEGQLSPHHRGSIWPTEHTRTHTRLLAPSTCLCLCLNIPTSLKAQSLLSPSLVFIPCAALSFSLSFSLHTEVGHSGSTVYSNAAASGEKSKETHRGENREKEGRTHSAQFNISALTKKENTHPHPFCRRAISAGVKVCLYDLMISTIKTSCKACTHKHTLNWP